MAESKVVIMPSVPTWRLEQFVKQTDLRKRPEAARVVCIELAQRKTQERQARRAA